VVHHQLEMAAHRATRFRKENIAHGLETDWQNGGSPNVFRRWTIMGCLEFGPRFGKSGLTIRLAGLSHFVSWSIVPQFITYKLLSLSLINPNIYIFFKKI